MALPDLFTQCLLGIHAQTDLMKKSFKSIAFKKLAVIRRVIVHAVEWRLKALHHQSPPAVALAKIDGTIHGLHALLQQPVTRHIKKHVGGTLVIDAIEKS